MNLGTGVMLHHLLGGSENSSDKYYNKIIEKCYFDKEEDKIHIEFKDGVKIVIWDNGQSCCESRYITCDDNLEDLVNQKLIKIEVKDFKEKEDSEWGGVHEQAFVEIATNKDSVTFCTHNEHNGYYGGFALTITELEVSK